MVVLGILSESYAWTFDQFEEYCTQIVDSEESTQLMKRACNLVLTRKNKLIELGIKNYTSFNLNYNTTGWVELLAGLGTYTITSANSTNLSWTPGTDWYQFRIDHNIISAVGPYSTSSSGLVSANRLGLIEFTNEELIPSNYWLQNKYITGFEWLPINTTSVTIGDFTNVQVKKVDQTNSYVLGKINKFDDRYNYYKVVVFDNQGNKIAWCQMKRNQDWYWSDGPMSYNYQTNYFDIKSRLIYLKQIYTVAIYASDIEINEANTEAKDSQVYTYIFLPSNAEISNGVITNYGSGDNYNSQDSTNDIINNMNDSSEVTNILGSLFPSFNSGNASGELNNIATEFGFTTLDNPFTTFLLHILESSYDALTLREPVVLTADYKTMHFVLSSEQFRTPDSNLKNFIRNCMIFLYLYGNYVFFHHLITLVETARIYKAVSLLGTDEFYDSDIL